MPGSASNPSTNEAARMEVQVNQFLSENHQSTSVRKVRPPGTQNNFKPEGQWIFDLASPFSPSGPWKEVTFQETSVQRAYTHQSRLSRKTKTKYKTVVQYYVMRTVMNMEIGVTETLEKGPTSQYNTQGVVDRIPCALYLMEREEGDIVSKLRKTTILHLRYIRPNQSENPADQSAWDYQGAYNQGTLQAPSGNSGSSYTTATPSGNIAYSAHAASSSYEHPQNYEPGYYPDYEHHSNRELSLGSASGVESRGRRRVQVLMC
ncbi:hypothetical protein T439DRAFT_384435 [Meredithblackwellia eburnea MCA 4105]